MTETTLLKLPPMLIVGGEITVPGEVRHTRLDEKEETVEKPEGVRDRVTERTTRREVANIDEYEAAHLLASRHRSKIRQVAPKTAFGLLAPAEREADLLAAIDAAKRDAALHNAGARHHFLLVSYVPGLIMDNSERGARAAREIAFELRGLTAELDAAVGAASVEKIREVATRARALAPILAEREKGAVEAAIQSARRLARRLVAEAEKKGRLVAEVVESVDLSPVARARAMFLEFEVPEEARSIGQAATPRALELETENPFEALADSGVAAVTVAGA